MKRARAPGVSWPFVGKVLLVLGLTTLALPHPGRLLFGAEYVLADADEILGGLALLSLGFGLHLLARSAEPRPPDSGE